VTSRAFTTRREEIVSAYVTLLKTIDGTGDFVSDIQSKVFGYLRFWDEIDEFPEINLNAGNEGREYQPGAFKWRFLTITFRVYVRDEDNPQKKLALILEDLETILEDNSSLAYTESDGTIKNISDISIISLSTDEGSLDPLGVGELIIEIRY